MTYLLTRRSFTIAAALCGALGAPTRRAIAAQRSAPDAIAALEAKHGGRLGVVAVDTGSGRQIGHRAEERFAMCSTHKVLTCAAVLAMVDQRQMQLDRRVSYSSADLLKYAPIARKNVDAGFMTVDALCAATIEWSDNTADDLLLGLIGGPAGWTRYARSIGDTVSRLDRTEPALNSAIPGDARDTTTPGAMVRDLSAVLLGNVLNDASRARLENWMRDGKITANLLKAGLPKHWQIGDKSGSGENGTRNDIAIIRRPEAAPILAAVYYTGSAQPTEAREKVIAEIGRIIAEVFAD